MQAIQCDVCGTVSTDQYRTIYLSTGFGERGEVCSPKCAADLSQKLLDSAETKLAAKDEG